MYVYQCMRSPVITITADTPISEAQSLMRENSIHHLPVADNGELVGLITITNVLAATDSFLRDDRNRIHANEIIVGDVMVKDVATVDVNASLRQAALFLEKHQIGCLPVMDDGSLVGIITETDFVAVAINLLEQLESSEPFEDDFDDVDVA